MKKIFFILAFTTFMIPIFALFENFSENPAIIAERQHTQLAFPALNYKLNIYNSLINLNSLSLFEEGRVLTAADKKKLTKNDLNFEGSVQAKMLDIGYQNWHLSLKTLAFFDLKVLDKAYTKIVLYGNETDQNYQTHVGSGSQAHGISKLTIDYAIPKELNLGMIPGLFKAENSKIVDYLQNLPFYAGYRFNMNYSHYAAAITDSEQKFGSTEDSTYYSFNASFVHSDSKSKGSISPSIGFGLMAELDFGRIFFSMDDLFLKLKYEDLAGGEYSKNYTDSLLYLQSGYSAFDSEFVENDSIRVASFQTSIKPSVSIGMEYYLDPTLTAVLKYSNSRLTTLDGLKLGISKDFGHVPLQIFYGNNGTSLWTINTGLNFHNVEWKIGGTLNGGLFGFAKGLGIESGLIFKF